MSESYGVVETWREKMPGMLHDPEDHASQTRGAKANPEYCAPAVPDLAPNPSAMGCPTCDDTTQQTKDSSSCD